MRKFLKGIAENVWGSDWKDILIRTGKTAIQAAVATYLATSGDGPVAAVGAAIAAALTVGMNALAPNTPSE